MKRFTIFLIIFAAASFSLLADGAWEEVTNPHVESVQKIASEEGVAQIAVADGYIYLTLGKPMQVTVFTILGQQMSSQKLVPGSYRTKISSRGIYIIRVGTVTVRVAV